MPQEVKLWRVHSGDKLEPYESAPLDLEERLERWIEADISVLSPDLLVIGRQVGTDFGGRIDLLCLDSEGNTVVVELKRDKTPRDVAAQVLEYASWVRGLSNEQIAQIASDYLGDRRSLDAAFSEKFDDDLPDVLNEDHRMIVVGSRIDSRTERIIEYLSEAHGVGINAAAFQFFDDPVGGSVLARVFLIEPERADQQVRAHSGSKRRHRLSEEELQLMAEEAGVGELYASFVRRLKSAFEFTSTTRSSIRFYGRIEGRRRVLFSLLPAESSKAGGIRFELYWEKLRQAFDLAGVEAQALLPASIEAWDGRSSNPDAAGYTGFFRSEPEVSRFVGEISKRQKS